MGHKLHNALEPAGGKHNRYCGPAAIAAITGMTTGEAAAEARAVTGKPSIRGMYSFDLLHVLLRNGFSSKGTESYRRGKGPTLKRWLADHYDGTALCVVRTTTHFWAMSNGEFVDTYFRMPSPLDKVHSPRARVMDVFYLEPPAEEVAA